MLFEPLTPWFGGDLVCFSRPGTGTDRNMLLTSLDHCSLAGLNTDQKLCIYQIHNEWLALSPHSKEVQGSIPGLGGVQVLPVSGYVFSNASVSKTCTIGKSSSQVLQTKPSSKIWRWVPGPCTAVALILLNYIRFYLELFKYSWGGNSAVV